MYKENIQRYLERTGFEVFRPKAVLFDMDGVIYDSMAAHAYAWNKAMKEFGLNMAPEEVYANEGMRGEEVIARYVREQQGREAPEEEIRTIYARKAEIISQEFGVLPKMTGTHRLMQKMHDSGMKILVVTGSGQPSTLSRVASDHPGLVMPEMIISSKDCTKGKPNPQPYLKGLEKAGVNPWEAIVVENAPLGVRAGVAAGIFTVAVNTGPLPDEMLSREGASIVFKTMDEFYDAWEEILSFEG